MEKTQGTGKTMMSDEPPKHEWSGEERRGLPIHIINYIDARLHSVTDQFNGKIDALSQEIYHLTQSITSFIEKQDESRHNCRVAVIEQCEKIVDEAIPTHPDNPDATPAEKRKEHRKAHASWIRKVDEEMEEWRALRKRVREWAAIGALGLILLALWQYLLNGPK